MKFWKKFTALFRRRHLDAEMAEEMRLHLERRVEENVAAGMSAEDARFAARREFGGMEQVKEIAREQRSWMWLEQTVRDVRIAVRKLANAKGFTVVALLTLAVGIGATTAIFGVIDSRLLRPIPGSFGQHSVHIIEHNRATGRKSQVSARLYSQLAQLPEVFEKTITLNLGAVDRIVDGDFVETPRGCGVTSGFFEFLGVPALVGRWLVSDETDPADANSIVISHAWWKGRFGGDPNIVGKQVEITNASWTIVGVMPRHFQFPNAGFQFWRPFVVDARARAPGGLSLRNYFTFARLATGVSEQRAQSALDVLAKRMASEFPTEYANVSVKLQPLRDYIIPPEVRGALWASTAAIALILVIVCANMANLQLARSGLRARELAICRALGASRWRIARQLLAESVVLSVAGGTAGLLLALWLRQPLEKLVPMNAPLLVHTGINGGMLAWTAGISVVCGVAFGFFPAWRSADIQVSETLKQVGAASSSGRKEKWVRQGLVVAQVALATVLLSGAGLLVRSVVVLLRADPGVNPVNLIAVTVFRPPIALSIATKSHQLSLTRDIANRLTGLPGVNEVGVLFDRGGTDFYVPGRSEPFRGAYEVVGVAELDYLRGIGTKLKEGRMFGSGDDASGERAAIVNESFALECWPGESALGKQFYQGDPAKGGAALREVIGVVRNFGIDSLEYRQPMVFLPMGGGGLGLTYLIRTRLDGASLIAAAKTIFKDTLPGSTVPEIHWIEEDLFASTGTRRLFAGLLAAFAVVGLFLAMLGVFGVQLAAVVRRTREIGIRMALGAEPNRVLAMVMREGFILVGVGVLLGTGAALALTRLLRGLLYGITPTDPLTFAAIGFLLICTALVACWLPARRAARVDPMVALRAE